MKKSIVIILAAFVALQACKKSASSTPTSPIEIAFPRIDTATFWLTIGNTRENCTARISSDGTLTIGNFNNYKGGTYTISITDSVVGATIKEFALLYPGHSLTQYNTGNLLQIVRGSNGREYYDLQISAGGPKPDSVVYGPFIDSL